MDQDPLSATFAALADPTRRAILARLSRGEASVGALAEPFAMSLAAVSRHLKVLERAGLIRRGRQAQWRPCTLAPEALAAADRWLDDYRTIRNPRRDRPDRHILDMKSVFERRARAGDDDRPV